MDASNRVALLIGQDDTVCSITTTHRPRPFHRATDGTLGQWLRIERTLGAVHTTEPIDTFLRDVLRWRTGAIHGLDRVYEGLRRWAVRQGHAMDRSALCRDLTRLAGLYGILTGKGGKHPDTKVEQELRHLREMGIDIHRPLTLRLLNDASDDGEYGTTNDGLAKALAGIAAWTTRLWLADRPTAGMNKAVVELAHGPGPGADEDFAEHWLGRIQRLRNSRVGVPSDETVREGIRTRKGYGGSATRSSFAILCAMMEAEQRDESPARDHLTIEHVMPQKLTDDWRVALGEEAEEKHGRYRDRLANLTLSGDATNSGMGAGSFDAKRAVYRDSSIRMTRRPADEDEWPEAAEWIKEQYERLQAILADSPGEGEAAAVVSPHQATPSGLSATGETAAQT